MRGPLVVTIQVLGFVPHTAALRRDGAKPGDLLYVSGTPGVAAAGLELLQSGSARLRLQRSDASRGSCTPSRASRSGLRLRGIATAAMDVSDGLLGDLGKLCIASGVGAQVDLEALPVAALADARTRARSASNSCCKAVTTTNCYSRRPRDHTQGVEAAALMAGCAIHRIGMIVATGAGVACLRNGRIESMGQGGYDHFTR